MQMLPTAAPRFAIRNVLAQFGNLMMKRGRVDNGFPEPIPFTALEGNVRVDPGVLEEMFGSPEQVIAKLQDYQRLGVDAFIYYASMGLGIDEQKRSMELFCREVMPAFQ